MSKELRSRSCREITIPTCDGPRTYDIEELVTNQSIDGLLYDLNLDGGSLTFTKDPFHRVYAQVITYLKQKAEK